MRPRKVFIVLKVTKLWFITVSTVKESFTVLIWDKMRIQVLAVNSDLPLFCEFLTVTVIWLTQSL